jgi:hypothetical protein
MAAGAPSQLYVTDRKTCVEKNETGGVEDGF